MCTANTLLVGASPLDSNGLTFPFNWFHYIQGVGVVLAIGKENLHRLFNFSASSCVFPSNRKL